MPPKLTKEFVGACGYEEAKKATGYIYMGRKEDLTKLLEFNDVVSHKESSRYYGCVFYPEPHYKRHPELSYDKKERYKYNKALFAGAIDARRSFVFVSQLTEKTGEICPSIMFGYTGDELFWLKDNEYTFRPSLDNPLWILAEPPRDRKEATYIRDYDRESGTEPHCEKDIAESPCGKPPRKLRRLDVSKQVRQNILERIRDEVHAFRPPLDPRVAASITSATPPPTFPSIHDSTEKILKRTGGDDASASVAPIESRSAATPDVTISGKVAFPPSEESKISQP